ncbi:unnamed protein product, partial [Candidula unifasciata]
QIRVVHVDKDLKPVIKPLTVYIVNPKESKLEEFRDTASRTVLPKFAVTVKASPGYIVSEKGTTGCSVTVEAIYTYGRGVQGKCHLILSMDNYGETIRLQASKQLDEAGKAEFLDLEWSRFARNIHRDEFTVQVTASVTDETGRTEAGQTSVVFYEHSVKVEILPKTTRVLRSGIPAAIFVRVSDHSGNPVDQAEVELETRIPGMKSVDTKLVVAPGETDVVYHFTPELQAQEEQKYFYHHDSAGTVVAKLTSNQEVMSHLSVFLYQSRNNSVISVQPADDK